MSNNSAPPQRIDLILGKPELTQDFAVVLTKSWRPSAQIRRGL